MESAIFTGRHAIARPRPARLENARTTGSLYKLTALIIRATTRELRMSIFLLIGNSFSERMLSMLPCFVRDSTRDSHDIQNFLHLRSHSCHNSYDNRSFVLAALRSDRESPWLKQPLRRADLSAISDPGFTASECRASVGVYIPCARQRKA
jgi:hypothetical protein